MINFYFIFNGMIWFDLIQTLTAIVGIIFLILNFSKTRETLLLQSMALRNSHRPIITAVYNYDYLSEEKQKQECFPVSIIVNNNPLADLRIELANGPAIDFSISETSFGEQRFHYAKLEVGDRIVLRYRVHENFLNPPTEWPDDVAMQETMRLYAVEIGLRFQDDNGFKYLQKITLNVNIGHDPVVHSPQYLPK